MSVAYLDFLAKFDAEFAGLLGKRAEGFRTIFRLLQSSGTKYYRILETGTLRILDNWTGDGQSTHLFDAFVNFHDGMVLSIDIDPAAITTARSVVSAKTHCVCSDSVRFLHDFAACIGGTCRFDMVYLDSYDFDTDTPNPSQFHHMKELTALGPLGSGTLVAVDDNFVVDGQAIGKGHMIDDYFSNIGVKLIHDGYQKIWRIP